MLILEEMSVAVPWLLQSLLNTELSILVIAQAPSLMRSFSVTSANIALSHITLKTMFLGYISVADVIGLS